MDAPGSMHVGSWPERNLCAGEVRVKVNAAGICAGDMYFYLGKNPYARYPQVCGHEIAGQILEVANDVKDFKEGEHVVIEPFLGCGACYPCRVGKSNCCANLRIIGVHEPGGYAESVVAPATHIHRVPGVISSVVASFAEPVAIAVQATRRGHLESGEQVLVLGCGPIGLALIEVIRAKQASVMAVDVLESRLEFARQLGAETLKADESLLPNILERTNGEGVPLVIEATGNIKAMEQCVELVAAGGRIVIVGLVKKGLMVSFPALDFTRKEMTILGSRASVNCFPEALDLLASGAIHYPEVATCFELWKAPEVFQQLASNPHEIHKGVLLA